MADWSRVQLILVDVPIEYMDCDSTAFVDGDEVIIEFVGQDWDQPKIIGFKENPSNCIGVYVFPGANAFGSSWFEEVSRTFKLVYNSESWAWKNPFPREYIYPGEDNFARVAYAATGENGLGFTVGGRTVSDTTRDYHYFDHTDIFDSVAESFSIGSSYPIEIFDLTFNSLKNGICIGHGGRRYWSDRGINNTYRYTISSDTWNWPASGRQVYNHASFVIDSVVYIVGGNSGDATGGTVYYGADNFGWGYPDYITDNRGAYIPQQNVAAYDDNEQSWSTKATCPVANFLQVRGWSLEGKGLVGGGSYTYQYNELVRAGYDTVEVEPGVFRRVQVHWVRLDIGLERNRSTYLYDSLTDSWTQKQENLAGSGTGRQATSTANDETVALAFSYHSPGGDLRKWYEYQLSTDGWYDKGEFGLYSYVDEDAVPNPIYAKFDRLDAAGAEL